MSGVTLSGSCHCGAVSFEVHSMTPYPFMICHCQTDTKTAGFFNCNIMGEAKTLKVKGAEHVKIYQAKMSRIEGPSAKDPDALSKHKRHFCGLCGSALYASDERWAENVYPFASCIDTPLPVPPEEIHIMMDFKAPHLQVHDGKDKKLTTCGRYPQVGIAEWHKQHGLYGAPLPTSEPKPSTK